jgi:hypothetical protein
VNHLGCADELVHPRSTAVLGDSLETRLPLSTTEYIVEAKALITTTRRRMQPSTIVVQARLVSSKPLLPNATYFLQYIVYSMR